MAARSSASPATPPYSRRPARSRRPRERSSSPARTTAAPGSTVVFRAYAVDKKTHKLLVAKDVKYFYVAIPNAGNVKLTYSPTTPGATSRLAWIGKWTVPTTYPAGTVAFKVLVKTQAKR